MQQCLDETAFAAASATRSTSFVTGIVDLTRRRGGTARLLDVVDDRSASALVSWVNQRETGWRAGIGVAALDPPAAMPAHCEPACPTRYACWTPSPSCA